MLGAETARAYKPLPQAYLASAELLNLRARAGDAGGRPQWRPRRRGRDSACARRSWRGRPNTARTRRCDFKADREWDVVADSFTEPRQGHGLLIARTRLPRLGQPWPTLANLGQPSMQGWRNGATHTPGAASRSRPSASAGLYARSTFTYSKSPGLLSIPTRGGAIQDANLPRSQHGAISPAIKSPSSFDGSHWSFCFAQSFSRRSSPAGEA